MVAYTTATSCRFLSVIALFFLLPTRQKSSGTIPPSGPRVAQHPFSPSTFDCQQSFLSRASVCSQSRQGSFRSQQEQTKRFGDLD
ncbi:uncharacterized protein BDZ83DRAFT_274493 [Colletotrichum acutatum]|uniref:Secreted protein n=1 Tax=Glomerella acutata TaxID=27357 RepID=A0AAD8XJ91_GLOAC|nr:uncharacterized protein BDZ83DRAFT_274493 [Colletotrichum acutatum]KAK1725970.1 hypothetical protein BDZ83DRAFT_274493 [Colletotrichum acutatum]